ncbi:MAG TPA: CoA pyrophosphatase [Caulobacteraceae bacterium]|nr:CoA pyrophosphatase [Caulobacteraceae bacterium]
MSASLSTSGPSLRALIAKRLDPVDSVPAPGAFRSDRDLNPEMDAAAFPGGYYPAAVLIGLIERPGGLNVLLTRRADTLRQHAGQIAFPGGRSDPGETAGRTAVREAQEEIGLQPSQVELLGQSTRFRLLTGFDVTPVVGFVAADFQPATDPLEVAEVFEAPFAFLMDPANRERRLREAPGPPRWHYAITWGDRVIWGATAAMLKGLHDRLWGSFGD